MDTAEQNVTTAYMAPTRQKRRPALSCERCRRRKIRCDRNTPCRQCIQASSMTCQYVRDDRSTLDAAPFDAEDTCFLVFDHTLATAAEGVTPAATSASGAGSPCGSICMVDSSMPRDLSDQDSPCDEPTQPAFPQIQQMDPSLPFLNDPGVATEPQSQLVADLHPTTVASAQGVFFKARYYGQSHWLNYVYQSSEVLAVIQAYESNESSRGGITYTTCKAIGTTMKTLDLATTHAFVPMEQMVPPRRVADKLVQAFLRTFQTVFGLVHVSSFRRDYEAFWCNPHSGAVRQEFLVTMFLVLSIGSAFVSDEAGGIARTTVSQWIRTVAAWSKTLDPNTLLSMDDLRIRCLLRLASQARSVKCENEWTSTGSLLHTAIHMGLHIDPERLSLQPMSPAEVESRRKLWATVLELELQSSMDRGSLLPIDKDDFDCLPPSNLDELSLHAEAPITPKPLDQLTHSSVQILLMATMPARLKIARLINDFRPGSSYETVLRLGSELSTALTRCTAHIEAYRMSTNQPSFFQTKLFDVLVGRFMLALHHPFAVKATFDPLYRVSRMTCLDTALSLLSSEALSGDDDFRLLRRNGAGPFRAVYRQCVLYLCRELTSRLATDEKGRWLPGSTTNRDEVQRAAVIRYMEMAQSRMEAGDKNIKCYLLVSCLLAQAEAMNNGTAVGPSISAALARSLDVCYSLLIPHVRCISEMQGSYSEPSSTAIGTDQPDFSLWDSFPVESVMNFPQP